MAQFEKHDMVIEDKKFSLFGEKGEKGMPRMFFSVSQNGNPSCLVFPNDANDTERKPIRGAMDPVIWSCFIEGCLEAFSKEGPNEMRLDLRAGKPNSTFTDSVMVMGKDEEGVCYLGLIKKDRAKKRFRLLPGTYSDFINKDGSPLSEPEKSRIFANAFIKALNIQVNFLIDKFYKPYVKEDQQGGGQQSGGGGQQSGVGGGGAGSSGFSDDIPF